ncbi:hypothetical protein HDU88_000454 [Geranomyces variabilis]|nr:hypothetical protein HDU88_000454 [Geranomyces variabilis]
MVKSAGVRVLSSANPGSRAPPTSTEEQKPTASMVGTLCHVPRTATSSRCAAITAPVVAETAGTRPLSAIVVDAVWVAVTQEDRRIGVEGDRVYARKTLDLGLARSRLEKTKDCIRRELAVLHQVPDHAHLVQLRAAYIQENKPVFLLSPWADLDLSDFFEKRESLAWWNESVKNGTAEHLLMDWAVCIAAALYALHNAHRKHRDLKPDNILIFLDEGGVRRPVLCDYGLSDHFIESSLSYKTLGSKVYGPPEQDTNLRVGRKADIFSFGAVLLELVAVLGGVKMKYVRKYAKPGYGHSVAQGLLPAMIRLLPADTSGWIGRNDILAGALAKDPTARPTSDIIWQKLHALSPGAHCKNSAVISPISNDGAIPSDSGSDSDDEAPIRLC